MKLQVESGSTRAPKGLFVGLTTLDIVFAFDKYPDEDTKNTSRDYTIAAGGPASNAAVVFSWLGGEPQLISSLGRGGVSDIARNDLARHGVRCVDVPSDRDVELTLSAIAVARNSGSRTIFTSPAIDDERVIPIFNNELASLVGGGDILLLDGHQTKLATRAACQARERGVTVVLDGDLYRPNSEDLLSLVDIVIFGKSFAVPGESGFQDAFNFFVSFGIKHVIATNGAKPIEFLCDGISGSIDVEEVPVIDTLGAGDFFHGAFCYFYCVHHNIQKALRLAARVAGKSVTKFGTRDWMRGGDISRTEES